MDYQNLILTTKSVREYKKEAVDTKKLKAIKDYAQECTKISDSISIDVRILSNSEAYLALDGVAGYQGNMLDAPHYILLLSDKAERYIENAGYIGEGMILKATELGVASCWITFQDSKTVKEKLNIVSDKEVVALIALGYDANAPKKGASVSLNPAYKLDLDEMVYIDKWGNGADAAVLEERGVLEAFAFAKLAPSTLNRQPWRFLMVGGKVILAVRKDENTNTYEEKIDAGVIMFFFEAIVGSTLFNLTWKLETPADAPEIPEDFEIVAYCMM
ncbi:MAG TPA: nitroreductase family protein [Candidatus Coprocola pullicola]|mgnify:CR=1 FL=1|nr:nitroreductase family protein [Candidatus Coprocola pullicola]